MTIDLISLVESEYGCTVIDVSRIYPIFVNAVLKDINEKFSTNFHDINIFCDWVVKSNNFELVKEKSSRLFTEEQAKQIEKIVVEDYLSARAKNVFITDEENLGFPNVYWRCVRAGEGADVGSVHADQWFWEIRNHAIPENHERVKLWMPLRQDDSQPSLLIFPGSHKSKFKYEIVSSPDGRHRPTISDQNVKLRLSPAPVKCGQAIIFHDRLLHGGRSTGTCRVSVEFTMAVRRRGGV